MIVPLYFCSCNIFVLLGDGELTGGQPIPICPMYITLSSMYAKSLGNNTLLGNILIIF
ncbi:hypothetical protein [Acinetobacter marinus]|uniref:hypothetical protein n=1 Tax=Acinetobacter marinus TaxID=281375 RepID=UPI00148A5EF7|nr:hypothetical protein [Acinetobacter marinus]